MSLRQQPQVPAAFEIRFSTTDSILEVFEIQSDQSSQNVPDPFKKRDKIPRSSGSIEQFSNFNNNNHNNTAPSQATPIVIKQKQRHHSESSSKKGLSSDQVSSSLKVKSSNAVGPEADKQQQQHHHQQRVAKNFNVERSSSLGNDMIMTSNITMDDDPIIRSPNNNKRQRPKIDEFVSEMDKNSNLGKAIQNNQFMDLNGKADMVILNNKKITPKSTIKNKINNMPTNTHKDDDKLLPKDGIATPPATPPRSPYIISQKRSEDGIAKKPITIKQINSEESQPITPPSSSGSTEFVNDLVNDLVSTKSTPRPTRRPSKASQSSRKRRGSHSPQKSESMLSTKRSLEMSAYQPPKKLQYPRGRRLSLASSQITTAEQPQESFPTQSPNKSKEIQKSQQSQSPITRSRIPRLSTSSKERPIVSQKISQGSLSSQGSNKYNESMELSSSYPGTSKPEPPRNIRTSRPIINTTFISDVEMRSESPTGCSPTSHSPTDYSPTNSSPTNYSPTSYLPSSNPIHQKKLISHDDVVIPTIAKKLKMKGQLHFVSHDALLGYSDEPEIISPMSENGYMDITDQVVNLFDGPKNKSHKKQSIPDSQHRRQRKNSSTGHSRNSSKTHYIAPRKQPPQQNNEEVPSPTSTQFENSSEHSVPHDIDIKNKRGRSRREEYIISVREDDDDMELIEPHSSMSLVPSEPSTIPAVQIESHEQIYQEKVEEPVPVQIPVVEEVIYNPTPAEVVSAPATTSGMKKKDKKKKQKKGGSDNLDEEDKYVRRSRCRCAIQ